MGDLIYRPIIEKFVWSYSRVSSFDDCPYKFFMHYIQGMQEEPMFYAEYGKFMHKLIEKISKGKMSPSEAKLEFLTGFSSNVRGERPSLDIVHNYINKGKEFFENFHGFQLNTIGVEKYFEFKVGDVPMCGIVDFIGEKDGEYYIIDNKSRDLKPRSKRKKPTVKDQELDDMLKQLYIYAIAVKDVYGKYPKSLCFNCFKSGVFIEEPFDINKLNEAVEWVNRTVKYILDVEDFYPSPEFFKCKYLCGLKEECCYYDYGSK